MLLIQQSSSSFRAWTSRALMVYFRRALLFLVVSPRQHINNNYCLLQQPQQQQKVYFSDAEDDEEILMIDDQKKLSELLFDRNVNNSNRIQINQSKYYLLKEYVFKKLSQGLNNSMRKSIQKDTINSSLIESIDEFSSDQSSLIFDSVQPTVAEQFELSISNLFSIKPINNTKINENKVPDDFVYQHQTNPSCSSWQQTPINYHNQIDTLPSYGSCINYTNPMLAYSSCPSCRQLSSVCDSFDNETSSSESNEPSPSKSFAQYSSTSIRQNLSQLSDDDDDDEDDIYEKYQTSFSHILHQTKSLDTIRKEDKLQSMLVLEPNTSIITVRQLTYHPLNPHNINYTSHICVRLIANRTDLTIECDTKPIGCKKLLFNNITKSTSINNEQQENSNLKNSLLTLTDQFDHQQSSNKNLQATSILIDIPYKMLYIDS